jgi:hypothetical protein
MKDNVQRLCCGRIELGVNFAHIWEKVRRLLQPRHYVDSTLGLELCSAESAQDHRQTHYGRCWSRWPHRFLSLVWGDFILGTVFFLAIFLSHLMCYAISEIGRAAVWIYLRSGSVRLAVYICAAKHDERQRNRYVENGECAGLLLTSDGAAVSKSHNVCCFQKSGLCTFLIGF